MGLDQKAKAQICTEEQIKFQAEKTKKAEQEKTDTYKGRGNHRYGLFVYLRKIIKGKVENYKKY